MAVQTTAEPVSRFESYGALFGYAYTFMVVNMLLIVANAPLAFLLQTVVDLADAWPLVLAATLTTGPSLAGAFAAFDQLRAGGASPRPARAFVAGYRRVFPQAALVSAATGAVVLVVVVDAAAAARERAFAVLLPLLALVLIGAIALAVTVLAAAVLRPGARLAAQARDCLYVAVRRWYLGLIAVGLLGLLAGIILVQPVLGMALAPAPLLYIVWANASYALTRDGLGVPPE